MGKTTCCCPVPAHIGDGAPADAVAARQGGDHSGMIVIPVGRRLIGSEGSDAYEADGEGPVRSVACPSFLMDRTAVTNLEFARFADDTGYVTEAEAAGWSFVFVAQVHPRAAEASRPAAFGASDWWMTVPGASWRAPDGPGSDYRDRLDHPCVHVSWNDASTYALWAGKRLPGEVEWEIAARGRIEGARYPWGDELTPGGVHRCNIWQGRFPIENTAEDGWLSTAPAESYEPNGYGLYNMVGNTWEWTADDWTPGHTRLKAMRGGSYLCHASYCNRYRVSARTGNTPNATSSHLGFRCAADLPESE